MEYYYFRTIQKLQTQAKKCCRIKRPGSRAICHTLFYVNPDGQHEHLPDRLDDE